MRSRDCCAGHGAEQGKEFLGGERIGWLSHVGLCLLQDEQANGWVATRER